MPRKNYVGMWSKHSAQTAREMLALPERLWICISRKSTKINLWTSTMGEMELDLSSVVLSPQKKGTLDFLGQKRTDTSARSAV